MTFLQMQRPKPVLLSPSVGLALARWNSPRVWGFRRAEPLSLVDHGEFDAVGNPRTVSTTAVLREEYLKALDSRLPNTPPIRSRSNASAGNCVDLGGEGDHLSLGEESLAFLFLPRSRR